jgi:hypothetical protein
MSLLSDPRTGSLAIALAVIGLGLAAAFDLIAGWWAQAAAVSELSERAEHMETRAQILAARSRAEGAQPGPILIEGATAAAATARLQTVLTQAVAAAGATLNAMEVRRREGEDDTPSPGQALKLTLLIDVAIAEAALPDFLAALENHMPLLTIDSLKLSTESDPGAAPPDNPRLNAVLVLAGYWAPQEGAP